MSTLSTTAARATIADLEAIPEKAELLDGRIVYLMASGHLPGRTAFRIARLLDDYAAAVGRGVAYGDNVGFRVSPLTSGRESFSPDAAYYAGPLPANPMRFLPGPPTLSVEVRSEDDYGPAAEAELAAKRADYFEAGTLVVWDVDPQARLIRKYRRDAAGAPETFGPGDVADAEPAAPGWRIAVEQVFA